MELPLQNLFILGRNWKDKNSGWQGSVSASYKFGKMCSFIACIQCGYRKAFQCRQKIVTDYRTEMETSTLCALLSCKLNNDVDCYALETPQHLLKKAKRATMDYNRQHSSDHAKI